MQSLNVLIAGEGKYVEDIIKSKYLNKLYLTSNINDYKNVKSISFNTFQELADKCRALQIDLVIVENEKWILQGIGDVLRLNYINNTAPNSAISKLALSKDFARSVCAKYEIPIPKKIVLPIEYPICVKADGFSKIAGSMQDILDITEELRQKSPEIYQTIYLEEYIPGNEYSVVSLFDGKHLLTFNPNEKIQKYSKKIEQMLVQEKADFIGFINSKIVENDSQIYNIGFNFEFLKPNIDLDLLYVLENAIYQKLDEINNY